MPSVTFWLELHIGSFIRASKTTVLCLRHTSLNGLLLTIRKRPLLGNIGRNPIAYRDLILWLETEFRYSLLRPLFIRVAAEHFHWISHLVCKKYISLSLHSFRFSWFVVRLSPWKFLFCVCFSISLGCFHNNNKTREHFVEFASGGPSPGPATNSIKKNSEFSKQQPWSCNKNLSDIIVLVGPLQECIAYANTRNRLKNVTPWIISVKYLPFETRVLHFHSYPPVCYLLHLSLFILSPPFHNYYSIFPASIKSPFLLVPTSCSLTPRKRKYITMNQYAL